MIRETRRFLFRLFRGKASVAAVAGQLDRTWETPIVALCIFDSVNRTTEQLLLPALTSTHSLSVPIFAAILAELKGRTHRRVDGLVLDPYGKQERDSTNRKYRGFLSPNLCLSEYMRRVNTQWMRKYVNADQICARHREFIALHSPILNRGTN